MRSRMFLRNHGRAGTLVAWSGHDRIEADTNNVYSENQRDIDYTGSGPGATLKGGAGNDAIVGSHFSDVLEGGSGHDAIFADYVNPFGTSYGHDHLDGGSGNDWLVGDQGNDVIRCGPETSPTEPDHDWLLGGAGDDTTTVRQIGTRVPLHPFAGIGSVFLNQAA